MLFAAYAPVGGGVCFLLVLVLSGVGLLAWIGYWRRGFRASAPRSRTLWVVAGLAVAFAILFPPMRRAGDWEVQATGQPISGLSAWKFDRSLFGYIPSYGWIGSSGRKEVYEPGCIMTMDDEGPYVCRHYTWVIDWLFLAGQAMVLLIVLLPFLRRPESELPLSSTNKLMPEPKA